RNFARSDAVVAVTAAGTLPYFSRRPALDLLGKTDARVARLDPHPGAAIGHAKFDMDGSLSKYPDLVGTSWPCRYAFDPAFTWSQGNANYQPALLSSRSFIENYRSQPVPLGYLLENGSVFVRRTSSDVKTLDGWRPPQVAP